MAAKKIKCVMVGDGTVGKTYMMVTYVNNEYPQIYCGTVFDNYVSKVTVNNEEVELNLWDTSGSEDYDRLRPLAYPDTDVVVICFSVVSEASFINIEEKWYPGIKHYCPKVPIILVGTKIDLRNDEKTIGKLKAQKEKPLIYRDGVSLMAKIGAVKYFECSALTREGLNEVFEGIVRTAINLPENNQIKEKSVISTIKEGADEIYGEVIKAVLYKKTKNKSKEKSTKSKFYA